MSIWAIIPARPLEEGKSRLASALSATERRRLNEVFFRQTLETTAHIIGPQRTLAISRSAAMLQIARSAGIEIMLEDAPHGLNEALEQAASHIRAMGASAILSLSCDLPFLAPEDLRAMIGTAQEGGGVTIAPDRAGTGTNAMLVSPIGAIPYRYGPDSFARHCDAARRSALAVRIVRRPGLAFDVDTPDDLEQMEEIGRERMHAPLHMAG